uniref:DHC_N1 domain-containing protein n=1 Tax=Schistocephalus solidus TaxID=70667 RepID=A0A183TPP2_SCHSO
LQKLGARKRALRACLFSKTITNPDCLTREMPRAVDLFGEVQAKYEQLEREWRTTVKLVSPLDPIKNYSAAVKEPTNLASPENFFNEEEFHRMVSRVAYLLRISLPLIYSFSLSSAAETEEKNLLRL